MASAFDGVCMVWYGVVYGVVSLVSVCVCVFVSGYPDGGQ